MQIKGTLIIDYVRIIRSNRDRNWDQWLTPEDWKIIDEQVLPSNWYSYDSFRRIGYAVFKEIAGSNLEVAREFGKFSMKNLLLIYKNILAPGNPAASLETFAKIRRTFIRGDSDVLRIAECGDKWLSYEMQPPAEEKDEDRIDAFSHQMSGSLQEIAEQAGAKNVRVEVSKDKDAMKIALKWD